MYARRCALFCVWLLACATSQTNPDPVCGDGVTQGAEACDDGNNASGDGCSATCEPEDTGECGDGALDSGEVCDDGNLLGGDGCSAACNSDETCGNGVLDTSIFEACDDGNTEAGDGCSPTCRSEGVCGDGVSDGGEACDDGNTADGDGCSAICHSDETCGNSIVDEPVGESCDDGNTDSGDGCSDMCVGEVCGNGQIDGDEVCDDGNTTGGDGCSADCAAIDRGLLYTVRQSDEYLRYFDPVTMEFTDVGPLGTTYAYGELQWDPDTQTLWMVDGRAANGLFTVDRASGAATLVGIHGVSDMFGLGYDPSTGRLYGGQRHFGNGFHVFDTATGAATLIGNAAHTLDSLAYDTQRNIMVGLAAGGGDMFLVDPDTGASMTLSSEGGVNDCGLAYDPLSDLLWAIDISGNLYTYDPDASYSRTLIQSGLGPHDGFTFVPGLPPTP